MSIIKKTKFIFVLSIMIATLSFAHNSFSSNNSGTIDTIDKYAYSENSSWISFGEAFGNVQVTDSQLTGYAYGENVGWISLDCNNDGSCATSSYKVANDGEGNLSGYAYSENTGWINFNPTNGGVVINAQGEFTGYAYGENIGWISFNCSNTNSCGTSSYKVKTDWIPRGSRPSSAFITPAKPDTKNISIQVEGGGVSLKYLPSNISQIAVSTTSDFKNASWEDISQIDDILNRYSGVSKFYIKFRTNQGAVSDVIIYERNASSDLTNAGSVMKLNDGDIVKTINNPDVYIIKYKNNKQYKRLILSPSVFKSYGHLKWNNLKTISQTQMDTYVTSNLVKETKDTIIYTLTPQGDKGERRTIDTTKPYDIDSIYEINKTDRDSYKLDK